MEKLVYYKIILNHHFVKKNEALKSLNKVIDYIIKYNLTKYFILSYSNCGIMTK